MANPLDIFSWLERQQRPRQYGPPVATGAPPAAAPISGQEMMLRMRQGGGPTGGSAVAPVGAAAPATPFTPSPGAQQQMQATRQGGMHPGDLPAAPARPMTMDIGSSRHATSYAPPASTTPFGVNVYNGDQMSTATYTPLGSGPAALDGAPGQQQYSGVSNAPATPMSPGADRNAFMNSHMLQAGAMNGAGGLNMNADLGQIAAAGASAWDAQQREGGLNARAEAGDRNALEVARINANREMGPVQMAEMRLKLGIAYDENPANAGKGPEHRRTWIENRARQALSGGGGGPNPFTPANPQQSAMDTAAGLTRGERPNEQTSPTNSIEAFMQNLANTSGGNPPPVEAVEAYIRAYFKPADVQGWDSATIRSRYNQYRTGERRGPGLQLPNPFSSNPNPDSLNNRTPPIGLGMSS